MISIRRQEMAKGIEQAGQAVAEIRVDIADTFPFLAGMLRVIEEGLLLCYGRANDDNVPDKEL